MKKVALSLGLAGLVASAVVGYDSWRKEPVYQSDINAVAPRSFDAGSASEANRLLLDFPDTIPGAREVKKYVTPGAEYTLVHIRQQHTVEGAQSEKTGAIQADIYETLAYLIEAERIGHIYMEGLQKEDEDNFNRYFKNPRFGETTIKISIRELIKTSFAKDSNLSDIYQYNLLNDAVGEIKDIRGLESKIKRERENPSDAFDINRKNAPDFNIANEREKYIAGLEEEVKLKERNLEKLGFLPNYNAIGEIAYDYDIKILAAETMDTSRVADETAKKMLKRDGDSWNPEDVKLIMDAREDVLLQYVANGNDPLAVTVYGGAHRWGGKKSSGNSYVAPVKDSQRDNIAEWNRNNPSKKFSLIEVTPTRYEEKIND